MDSISRVLSERGEVLDSASEKLARLRRETRIARDRLMSRLQKYLTDSAPKLQEQIITQRDGRYVIPLRAEFKGQIKAVIHDQSASGATLFIEPLPVVELNNTVRELELQERDEERRILAELSSQIGGYATEIKYGIENLAALDLCFAKAKYAEEIRASEPVLKKEEKGKKKTEAEAEERPAILLMQARHPLLDPETVVPVDFNPKPGTRAVVITGPNTGGKTVTLKTVGLLVLMAQSGLHIPAESGSELPLFQAVWADIGDEQSIEQSLSTFSGHITNIIRILKKADARSLVILDELGAGTDPQEGAALARAILSHLLERGITSLIATHYPELKTFIGMEHAPADYLLSLRPDLYLPLWKGSVANARWDFPVSWSNGFDDGRPLRGNRTPSQLDRLMLFQAVRLAPTLMANIGAGMIVHDSNGTLNELLWQPGDGSHRFRFRQAFAVDSDTHSTNEVYLGAYRYRYAPLDASLEATAGRFWSKDTGFTVELKRFFGDTAFSIYYKNVHSTDNERIQAGGVQLSFPLTLRREMNPSPVQVKGNDEWNYAQETEITSKGLNQVGRAIAINPQPSFNLATVFYNRDRLSESYLKLNLLRLRDAYLRYGLKE